MSSKGDENSGDQNLEMALLGEEERETERGSGEHGLRIGIFVSPSPSAEL
jgi:hypothetical protein